MNNAKIIWIVIGVIVAFLTAMILLWPKNHPWWLTLNESDNPYDIRFFYELIEKSNPDIEMVHLDKPYNLSLEKYEDDSTLNIVHIAYSTYIDSLEISHLMDFVEEGNKFISFSHSPPIMLMTHLLLEEDSLRDVYELLNGESFFYSYDGFTLEDDSVQDAKKNLIYNLKDRFGTREKTIKDTLVLRIRDRADYPMFYRSYKEETDSFRYMYFTEYLTSLDQVQVLGTQGEDVNLITIPHGKGAFYFHSTPLALTNFHLARSTSLDYIGALLAEMNDGDVLIDDIFHSPNSQVDSQHSENPYLPESPISFILSIESLRWAWYLMIAGALLFLVFRTRREQRVIPVIPPVKNNSLEFASTVGRLYYKEKNHKRIAQELCFFFSNHIRKRYHINSKLFDEDAKKRFIKIYPDEKRKINILLHMNKKVFSKESVVSEEELQELYDITRYFILKA